MSYAGSGLCPALAKAGTARLHMPGHKGRCFLGCEPWDITEIHGADALYEAEGILAESEQNAAALFGSQRTCYSTEGLQPVHPGHAVPGGGQRLPYRGGGTKRPPGLCLRRRSAGFEIRWLWPEESRSLCGCPISPRPAGRGAGKPAGASGGGVTSPARTIWAVWRKYRLGPGVPPARHLTAGGQRPWGLSAVFRTIPPPPGFGR